MKMEHKIGIRDLIRDCEYIEQGLLDWLNEKRLIQSIIELLDPSHDRDTHDNASRLLIEVSRVYP